jgi:hypothetical protein
MPKLFSSAAALASVAVAVGLLVLSTPSRPSAEAVLGRLLADAPATIQRAGGYVWLEEAGVGVRLHAAPAADGWPRLLAGDATTERRVRSALYELDPDAPGALRASLSAEGYRLDEPRGFQFRPRVLGRELEANLYIGEHREERLAHVVEFQANGREFAVLVRGEGLDSGPVAGRREALLSSLVMVPGANAGSISPLLIEGRYACALPGWRRSGERYFKATPDGRMALRFFTADHRDFPGADQLRLALEAELEKADYRRAAGVRPEVAGSLAYMHEYFRDDGLIQLIMYVRLEGAYLVALFQAPAAMRDTLRAEVDAILASAREVGMLLQPPEFRLPFSVVRNIRALAWREGERIHWGALFDDTRQQPVVWREDGVAWEATLYQEGEPVNRREGTASSSRALNPLTSSDERQFRVPAGSADLEVEITIGGIRSTARVLTR